MRIATPISARTIRHASGRPARMAHASTAALVNSKRAPVQPDLPRVNQTFRTHRDQQLQPHIGQRQTYNSAHRRQHEALGQQLSQQTVNARAQRHPHRDLALPRHRACQLQIRHVGARHQQHEPHRTQQQQHAYPQLARHLLAQRTRIPFEAAIEVGVLARKRQSQPPHFFSALRRSDSVPQSRRDFQEAHGPHRSHDLIRRKWKPDRDIRRRACQRLSRVSKVRRQHADHRISPAVQIQALPHHVAASAESPLPEPMRQHHHIGRLSSCGLPPA